MRGLLLMLLLAGCVTGPGNAGELPLGDDAVFEEEVQPVLGAGCANPSCHGSAGRPLEVFARFQHRLDPDRLHFDEPITADELSLNQEAAAALLLGFDEAVRSPLLTKPLHEHAGGSAHVGGAVFGDTHEPGYGALAAWAQDAIDGAD